MTVSGWRSFHPYH